MTKTYEIQWLETKDIKGQRAYDVSLVDEGKVIQHVTIWEFDKNHSAFPNFEELKAGGMVSGNLWQKDGSKFATLFAPDETRTKPVSSVGGNGQNKKDRLVAILQEALELLK
jgi:hypothetical protein